MPAIAPRSPLPQWRAALQPQDQFLTPTAACLQPMSAWSLRWDGDDHGWLGELPPGAPFPARAACSCDRSAGSRSSSRRQTARVSPRPNTDLMYFLSTKEKVTQTAQPTGARAGL